MQQGTLFVQANAGKARSYGFEGDLRWVPNRTLTLFATYSYNNSRFTTGAYDGNHFRLSPDNAALAGRDRGGADRAGADQLRAERDLSVENLLRRHQ